MSELRDLYQEVILDHYRNPRNFREIHEGEFRCAEGHNPLCGDEVSVFLQVDEGVVRDATFQGSGCAISMASASLMTEVLKGKSEADAARLFEGFQSMVTGEEPGDINLGKLAVFEGVREFPSRIKCAVLAWHTLNAAINNNDDPVSTE